MYFTEISILRLLREGYNEVPLIGIYIYIHLLYYTYRFSVVEQDAWMP